MQFIKTVSRVRGGFYVLLLQLGSKNAALFFRAAGCRFLAMDDGTAGEQGNG